MCGLSPAEIGIVVFIVLLVMGAGKVPRLGEALGEFLAGYRKGTREDDERIRVREKTPDERGPTGPDASR